MDCENCAHSFCNDEGYLVCGKDFEEVWDGCCCPDWQEA